MARVATFSRRLAGQVRADPVVYAEIVRTLARHERVDVIVNGASWEKRARAVLEKADALSDNVSFHRWRTNRVWTRDSGCIFLTPPASIMMQLPNCSRCTFNSTAGPSIRITISMKKVGERMAKDAGARVVQPVFVDSSKNVHRVVLEGGSIDVNGCGALLTTEECLLSTTQQRNPSMDRAAYEKLFATTLARIGHLARSGSLATTLTATSMTSPALPVRILWFHGRAE